MSLFCPVIPPYLLPSLLPPSQSLLAPLMVTFPQPTIGLGAATQGWAFGAKLGCVRTQVLLLGSKSPRAEETGGLWRQDTSFPSFVPFGYPLPVRQTGV